RPTGRRPPAMWRRGRAGTCWPPPTGQVVAEYGQRTLQARRAEYDPEANRLILAGQVRLEEPGLTVEADRLEADLGPERYHLEGRVRLERAGEDGRVSRLTAARLTYQALQGEAWAEGAV